MTSHSPSSLGLLPLFETLSPCELTSIHPLLSAHVYKKGTTLMTLDGRCRKVYIVVDGSVKVFIRRGEKNLLLAILGPGEVLGDLSALKDRGHSATVITLEKTRLLSLEADEFVPLLKKVPEMNFNYMHILAERLLRVTDQAEMIATLDVMGRVARQLLLFEECYGQDAENGARLVPLPLTQTDLGTLVGATRENVSQAIGRLKKQGCLHQNKARRYVVTDKASLTQFSDCKA